MSTVEFTLNGQPVKAPAGQSIFNIAKDLGIAIPHLCHKDGLAPDGNCRACVVEIKGEIASGADASAEFVVAAMRSAFEDSGSRAVVLLINSPGGSPVQEATRAFVLDSVLSAHGVPPHASALAASWMAARMRT